jgi:hypothetical protein
MRMIDAELSLQQCRLNHEHRPVCCAGAIAAACLSCPMPNTDTTLPLRRRVFALSITRNGILCDMTDFNQASDLISTGGPPPLLADACVGVKGPNGDRCVQEVALMRNWPRNRPPPAGTSLLYNGQPLLSDGSGWPMYIGGSAPNVKIFPSPILAPNPPPSPPFGSPICPRIPYNIFDPVQSVYCSTESSTTYVHCQAGGWRALQAGSATSPVLLHWKLKQLQPTAVQQVQRKRPFRLVGQAKVALTGSCAALAWLASGAGSCVCWPCIDSECCPVLAGSGTMSSEYYVPHRPTNLTSDTLINQGEQMILKSSGSQMWCRCAEALAAATAAISLTAQAVPLPALQRYCV